MAPANACHDAHDDRWRRVLRGVLAVLLLAGGLVTTTPPATAGACPAPGGTVLPFRTIGEVPGDTALVVNGGGWGHGVGMSQYGAQGAARLGCDTATILATYYVGTSITTLASQRPTVAVHLRRIASGGTTLTATGAVPWRACDLSGTDCPTVRTQPASSRWRATGLADGTFVLHDPATPATSCPLGTATTAGCHWRGGDGETRLRAVHDGTVVRIEEIGRRFRWGWTEFDYTSASNGRTFVTQYVTGGQGVSALDRYLRGLAEMPTSWETAALQAQAIAGRSYAEATIRSREAVYGRHAVGGYVKRTDCRCDLFATTVDQVYKGWDHESTETGRWRAAVDATAGKVLVHGDRPVAAFYSSSHGGWSDSVRDVWGSDLAYLPAVDTSRWEQAAGNSRQRWTRTFTAADLARRFGVAEFTSLTLERVGTGGRAVRASGGGAVLRGRDGAGAAVTRRYSGEQLRSVLSLWSANVRLQVPTTTTPPPTAPPPAPAPQPAPAPAPSAPAEEPSRAAEIGFERIAGEDRVATGIAAAKRGWSTSDVVVLARDDDAADALAGSALAGQHVAPLLVTPSSHLDPRVGAFLQRLQTRRVHLLGGHAALSPAVEQAVRDLGIAVDRVAGPDRHATAVEVSRRLDLEPGGVVLLVRGRRDGRTAWADALAVAGLAAARARDGNARPILIAEERLPAVTAARIRELAPAAVAMIGGQAVLPPGVDADLVGLGVGLEQGDLVRYRGSDRWGTSRAIADLPIGSKEVLVVARGRGDFVDGLFAGPLAARLGGRMLLVPSDVDDGNPWQPGQHADLVDGLGWDGARLVVVGGTAAVGDDVGALLVDALG